MFLTNKEIHWKMIMLKKNMLFSRNCFCSNFYYNVTNAEKDRSSRPEVFCKKCVLRNFAKFTEKHQRQSLFFNKDFYLKRDPGTGVFL